MAPFQTPVCIFLLLSLLTTVAAEKALLSVHPRMYIAKPEEGYENSLGLVGGVRSCGGPGQTVQWRYETCNGDVPCKLPGDGVQRSAELEFIPTEDINGLGLRFIVITEDGARKAYDRPIADSAVQGGQRYIIHQTGGARKEMIGRSITFQYILYRVDNNNIEICAEADFVVVDP